MKKLALLTTALAVIALPAMADHSDKTHVVKTKTYSKGHVNKADDDTVKLIVNNEENIDYRTSQGRTFYVNAPSYFDLNTGDRIMIEGRKVYYVTANGYRYFAPNGPYTTKNGLTFYALDGLVERVEGPAEIVYIDPDLNVERQQQNTRR